MECQGVLLLNGDFFGTLNAARLYKKAGFRVVLADADRLSFAAWSNAVDEFILAPKVTSLLTFKNWLLEQGRRYQGFLLYPTSDDLCWIIARFQEELSVHYRIHYPSYQTVIDLLDKSRLYELARQSNLQTIPTTVVQDKAELARFFAEQGQRLMIKPKSQIGLHSKVKGFLADDLDKTLMQWQRFQQDAVYDQDLLAIEHGFRTPLVQRYLPEAQGQTYSVAGFISRSQEWVALRAARKVFQYPVNMGVGLCFEHADLQPEVVSGLIQLLRSANYFGVFEAEFIYTEAPDGEPQFYLMDLNPRFYGQMGFEIERNLPLPLLVIADHNGDLSTLKTFCQPVQSTDPTAFIRSDVYPVTRYMHAAFFRLLLWTQRLGRRMNQDQLAQWQGWLQSGPTTVSDFIASRSDPRPLRLFWLRLMLRLLRHPRSTLRNLFA